MTPFLTLYFHTIFPRQSKHQRAIRFLLLIVSLLTVATYLGQSLPNALNIFFGTAFEAQAYAGITFLLMYVVSWLGSIGLLLVSLRETSNQSERWEVGLVAYSSLIALSPVIILSILPFLVIGQLLVSFPYTLPFLSIIPIGYVYAIRRYQLIRVERTISRTATIAVTLMIVASVYSILFELLRRALPITTFDTSWVRMGVILLVSASFAPLREQLQKWFDQLLYGGWYDYRSVVSQVSDSLFSAENKRQALAQSLAETIQGSMNVRWAGVLLLEDGQYQPQGIAGDPEVSAWFGGLTLEPDTVVIKILDAHERPMSIEEMHVALNQPRRAQRHSTLWHNAYIQLFVPMRAEQQVGVILLGLKFGGDPFGADDLSILENVNRQTALAIENVDLAINLAQKARDSERFLRKASMARDQERQRISREIHDEVVQALVGFKYRLAEMQSEFTLTPENIGLNQEAYQLQEQCGELIKISRNICYDLRPAVIDLGLAPGIRSLVERFGRETGTDIHFEQAGDSTKAISEEIVLCLIRCTQEALVNIRKHAQASTVTCMLDMRGTDIRLIIVDDGVGMALPDRLSQLMNDGHFGLVGIRERVELLGGSLNIDASLGHGTRLDIQMSVVGLAE